MALSSLVSMLNAFTTKNIHDIQRKKRIAHLMKLMPPLFAGEVLFAKFIFEI
jgi:hypothetical protein